MRRKWRRPVSQKILREIVYYTRRKGRPRHRWMYDVAGSLRTMKVKV